MLSPRDYQDFAAFWLARRGGGILGDEVGLGKSFSFSLTCQVLGASRVLLIVPKCLKAQWTQELQKYEMGQGQVHVHECPAWVEVKVKAYNPDLTRTYIIAHYEQFQFADEEEKEPKTITKYYLSQQWDVVGCDEVHYIKNRNSQRARLIKKLNTKVKVGLTGTPVAERPDDLWSLVHWLNPKEFSSYWAFVNLYCDTETEYKSGATRVLDIKLTRNPLTNRYTKDTTLKLLYERVKDYLLVRRLADVGLELPPKTVIDVPIELGEEQRAFYNRVKKEIKIELEQEFGDPSVWDLTGNNALIIRNAASRFVRLLQTTSAPSVFKVCPTEENAKLGWLEEFLNDNPQPVLIMTRFRHTAEKVQALLEKLGRADCMTGTMATLGTGLNLQHFNYMVLVDAPQSRLENEQVEGRIHRSGQGKPTFIFHLSAIKTSDQHAWGLIKRKDGEVNIILDWLRGLKEEL